MTADPAGRLQENSARAFPLAKINTVVPDSFPAQSEIARLSPRWRTYSKAEILELKSAGLVLCVNPARNLWKWTHAGRLQGITHSFKIADRGRISLAIPKKLSDLMESEMALRPSWSLQEA